MAIKKDQTVWGIHGGRTGDADSLFLKNNVIALGWVKIGDLSKIPADRESFKIQLAEKYPDKKPGAIRVDAGQLYRFVHEVQIGNFVVYPSKVDHKIPIGKIESLYKYQEKLYPHVEH